MNRFNELWRALNEEQLTSKQRSRIADDEFGIPEIRSYPLTDKIHILQAVRMFNHVDKKYEEELARNLIKAIKKHKMDISVGEDNRFYKYFMKDKNSESVNKD